MENEIKSDGACRFCKKIFSYDEINKHLSSCGEYALQKSVEDVFLIKVEAYPFWIYFEAEAKLTLKRLDKFFRDLWVECCGHLSEFKIKNVSYMSSLEDHEPGEKSMNASLVGILKPKLKFSYEYDFGTTTEVSIECISTKKGNKGIHIIARNNLPEFQCSYCKNTAEEICAQCVYEENGFLCKECAKKHKCEIDFLLPVVNSPRLGMCGFTGEDCPLINK